MNETRAIKTKWTIPNWVVRDLLAVVGAVMQSQFAVQERRDMDAAERAHCAYDFSDAMMAERKKRMEAEG